MDNIKVKEIIEMCYELGHNVGHAKLKNTILEIMRKEEVTAEEANKVFAENKECRYEVKTETLASARHS